jgi:TPP-dependent pyruvate/acetoin dehydrogenase alpha subunit
MAMEAEAQLSDDELIDLCRLMLLTRRFEEKSRELCRQGKLFDSCHMCIGEEAVTVGACYKLKKEDIIMPSLRGRGAYITKGVNIGRLLAVMYGKQIGTTMPKENSHHISVPELGILPGTGIIGADISRATGAALAAKLRGTNQVVVDFFGDGASNRGDFHESLNLGAIWKLPVVFICENNHYAFSTPISKTTAVENISARSAGYGIPGVTVNGNDVLLVYKAAQEAVKRARKGLGPTLIECKTYRWFASTATAQDLRPRKEVEQWKKNLGDPIEKLEEKLVREGILIKGRIMEIEAKIEREIREAVEFAEKSPFPKPEEALMHVYGERRM